MGRSGQRRKKDKARRTAAARQRRAGAQRRTEEAAAWAAAEARADVLYDPATPVDVLAKTLAADDPDEPASTSTATLLAEKRGPEGLAAIVEAWAALRPPEDPGTAWLSFAATAAALRGEPARARELLDRAMAPDPDPLAWAGHLRAAGRLAEVLETLAPLVADPDWDDWYPLHAYTLEEAHAHLGAPPGECPCGTGRDWAVCCGPRERAALDRFADRSVLYALREAATAHLAVSAHVEDLHDHVEDWLARACPDGPPSEDDPIELLAAEHAWLIADDEDDGGFLAELAAHPATAPEVAAAARAWAAQVHYGLWQLLDYDTEGPGRWCLEVCTGRGLYVSFAPEQIADLPRWTVLLGAVVPVDGAWRSTAAMLQLSPGEADALCETVRESTAAIAAELAGRRRSRRPRNTAPPFGRAEPHGVFAEIDDPAGPAETHLTSTVLGSLLPTLHAHVQAVRTAPPRLTNTDGDPLCLIKARIAVRSPDLLAPRLAAHPDIEPGENADPGERSFVWYGAEIPAEQRAEMLAEVAGQLPGPVADTDEPARWVRGQLQLRGRTVRVELNSRERLERLLNLLRDLDAAPEVVEQSRVEPAQDLAWPARTIRTGPPPPRPGEEDAWTNAPLPELRGRSPREAAAGGRDRWRLEALLRQFEYDADVAGREPCDLARLRAALGMVDH
ncbi:MAG: hypothetical protein ACT4QG_05625 [Sporichthyaceae bacterium]